MKRLFQGFILLAFVSLTYSCDKEEDAPEPIPEEPKTNNQQYVTVNRDPGQDSYSMIFSKDGTWTIYQGTSPENIDETNAVAETSSSSVDITGLNPEQRYYFNVKINDEIDMVSETRLAIEGQRNYRDLGGIIALDQQSVKWGMVYRSGHMADLTDADVNYMASLNLTTLVDFRFDEEIAGEPDNIPNGIDVINFPIEQGSFSQDQITQWLIMNDTLAIDTLLLDANRVFVTDFQDEFGSFLNLLEDGEPLVYHCTAGKDRAGYATALFLSALGVDRDVIIQDYLASNEYNAEMIEGTIAYVNSFGMNGELLRPVLEVKVEYINEAFETIDNQYGGMDNYLDLLGVDTDKLKSLYLE